MDLAPPTAARAAPAATGSPAAPSTSARPPPSPPAPPPSKTAARPPATPAHPPATPGRVASANASAARLRTPFKSPMLKKPAATPSATPAAPARPPRPAVSSAAKPFRTPVRATPAPPTKRAAPDTSVPPPPPAFRTPVRANAAAAVSPSTARPSPRRIGTAKIMVPAATPRRAADRTVDLDPDLAHYDVATRTAQRDARNVADKVQRLQRFHAYREKNELATVARLAGKWQRLAARAGNLLVDAMRADGGIEAMVADHVGSEPLPEGDVPKVFSKLQIPIAMLDYNPKAHATSRTTDPDLAWCTPLLPSRTDLRTISQRVDRARTCMNLTRNGHRARVEKRVCKWRTAMQRATDALAMNLAWVVDVRASAHSADWVVDEDVEGYDVHEFEEEEDEACATDDEEWVDSVLDGAEDVDVVGAEGEELDPAGADKSARAGNDKKLLELWADVWEHGVCGHQAD
ncbi:hypothetical protein GGF32_004239 [Allomyces javanicus]|nr:hypothetical protein GGF32_004239 [Allomyces javanicus]